MKSILVRINGMVGRFEDVFVKNPVVGWKSSPIFSLGYEANRLDLAEFSRSSA